MRVGASAVASRALERTFEEPGAGGGPVAAGHGHLPMDTFPPSPETPESTAELEAGKGTEYPTAEDMWEDAGI